MTSKTVEGPRARPGPRVAALATTFLMALTGGCITPRSYASMVHRDDSGGVIALEGPDRVAAEQDADRIMRAQCGEYRIVAENRVRTGERTTSSAIATADPMLGYGPYPPPYAMGYAPGYAPGFELGYPPGMAMGFPSYAPGLGAQQAETTTRAIYERQITYRCVGPRPAEPPLAPPPPPAAPPQPPQPPIAPR